MNFNEKQSKSIYDFIMMYNSDDEFKTKVQKLYDNEISSVSILHIYALEEVLRYGNKGIFNKFLVTKGTYTDEQAVDLFDNFIKLLNDDANFKQYKMEQLMNAPETLSAMEKLAFTLISMSQSKKYKMHDEMTDELEYDSFNPILYSNDKQIRRTLENLLFGEFIHKMLELPAMKPVKVRQKQSGMIANVDKPLIIEKIQSVISNQGAMTQFKQAIDGRFVKVKMAILLGEDEEAFKEYLKFNTNISANEILGIEKDYFIDDMYEYFMDMINKSKGRGKTPNK